MLKSKMKVLVDKIEEYRSTEEAMRSALLTAQKMANSLVAEAEEKRAQLLREAENAANARMLELRHEIASEELRLTQAQQSTAAFVTQMKELLAKEIQFLNDLPQVEAEAPSKETPVADEVTQKVKEIEESMQKLLKEDDEPLPEEDDFSDTKDMGDLLQRVEPLRPSPPGRTDADATRRHRLCPPSVWQGLRDQLRQTAQSWAAGPRKSEKSLTDPRETGKIQTTATIESQRADEEE